MDLALDDDGDLFVGVEDLKVLDGADAIVQHIQIRLLFFLGDWFLDLRIGIPWLERILGKSRDLAVARRFLRSTVATTPGVSSIDKFVFDYEATTRALDVDMAATSDTGEPLEFNEELILPIIG